MERDGVMLQDAQWALENTETGVKGVVVGGLGRGIRRARDDRSMSRAQIEALTGIPEQKLYRIEQHGQAMTIREFSELLNALDASPEEIGRLQQETDL